MKEVGRQASGDVYFLLSSRVANADTGTMSFLMEEKDSKNVGEKIVNRTM
jgi:hypothetical protein